MIIVAPTAKHQPGRDSSGSRYTAELGLAHLHVLFHRRFGETQMMSDLLVSQPSRRQFQHRALTPGKTCAQRRQPRRKCDRIQNTVPSQFFWHIFSHALVVYHSQSFSSCQRSRIVTHRRFIVPFVSMRANTMQTEVSSCHQTTGFALTSTAATMQGSLPRTLHE